MKQKINIFIYFTCFLAFVFADKISSSANKIQVDYSDVKYDIRGRDFNADLALRKLLFSATRSNFNTRNESAGLVTGPSKLNIQGLDLSITTDGRRGIERLDFSIGNLSFDINKCSIQLIDDFEEPRINFFDSRLSMSNISLDLSYFSLDRDIEQFLRDSNVILNKITVNQATGSMKYDESDKLSINLNGFTSLGNFKVDLIGNINERDIEDSQFEKFNIQISNISSDLKKIIKKYEIESGEKLEIKNGVLNIDIKERLEDSYFYRSSTRSYTREAEIQMKNMVKGASTFYVNNGQMPADCFEEMELAGLIEMKQSVIDSWDFQCDWEFDYAEREIVGTITATSTEENYAGIGKVIQYDILEETFSGYRQGRDE